MFDSFDTIELIKRKEVRNMWNKNNCCGDIKEKVNCTTEKTDTGIVIKLEPKDSAKIKSFQNMIESCKDFCGCCK